MENSLEKPVVRCAIYTRKSKREGLEQEFNTLHAQREAAEHYIKSMCHEGWVAIEDKYDDGGFSGATADRPALQRLLEDIDAGKVDCIVTYKVDRLSRSLLDFSRLLALLEEKGVSFVSTTQQFNTGEAIGRLTLNMLLSFAQFEREMIADRTRDKIAAARRKGKWLGTTPAHGYIGDRDRHRLVSCPRESEEVRTIYQWYLECSSSGEILRRIQAEGWPEKEISNGRKLPWNVRRIHKILRHPDYLGTVTYQGETFEGEHEAIVDKDLFEAVQRKLDAKKYRLLPKVAERDDHLVQGIIRCGACGSVLSPGATKAKTGTVYRYYTCRGRKKLGCAEPRLGAQALEPIVVERVRTLCNQRDITQALTSRVRRDLPERKTDVQRQLQRAERIKVSLQEEGRELFQTFGSGGSMRELVKDQVATLEDKLQDNDQHIKQLKKELKRLDGLAKKVDDKTKPLRYFDEAWEGLSAKERKALIRLTVKEVRATASTGALKIVLHDLDTPEPACA